MALLNSTEARLLETGILMSDLHATGAHYHESQVNRWNPRPGDTLFVLHDKDNVHDANASAICARNDPTTRVAWIPKGQAHLTCAYLKAGRPLTFKVTARHVYSLVGDVHYGPALVPPAPPVRQVPDGKLEVTIPLQKAQQVPSALWTRYHKAERYAVKLRPVPGKHYILVSDPATDIDAVAYFYLSDAPKNVLDYESCYIRKGKLHVFLKSDKTPREQISDALEAARKAISEGTQHGTLAASGWTAAPPQPNSLYATEQSYLRDVVSAATAVLQGNSTVSSRIQFSDNDGRQGNSVSLKADDTWHFGTGPLWVSTGATGATIAEQNNPTTTKENTMNFSNAFNAAIQSNKTAAAQAGYLEAGRIANNQVVKLASKHLPMMVRGYADSPVGHLVIANIAAMAAQQLRPQDATLRKVTEAMMVSAFQTVYQQVDIEGFINSVLDSKEYKRAAAALGEDDKETN